MKMQHTPILDATEAQRRTYAVNFLGLDLDETDTDDTILAKIMSAQNNNEMIFVAMDVDPAAPTVASQVGAPPPLVDGAMQTAPDTIGAIQGSLGHNDPRAIIRIDTEERNGQPYNGDVPVGVNGRCWQIKRGVEGNVPWRVVEALKLAVKDNLSHDGYGNEIITQSRAYPWNLISGPSAAEIAAWKDRTDSALLP